jgi:hypothetical protein
MILDDTTGLQAIVAISDQLFIQAQNGHGILKFKRNPFVTHESKSFLSLIFVKVIIIELTRSHKRSKWKYVQHNITFFSRIQCEKRLYVFHHNAMVRVLILKQSNATTSHRPAFKIFKINIRSYEWCLTKIIMPLISS